MNVEDIRYIFKQRLASEDFVTDKTGVKTIEIVGASFTADSPAIFGKPTEYIQREIEWYESQSLNVADIPGETPQIWKDISDANGEINSNYGFLIHSDENGFQYQSALEELHDNPNSRRALMIYNRPSMHTDYCENGMSDFICTNAVQYLIRGEYLDAVVQMRSNDAVFGYKNDYAWQKHVLDNLAYDLRLTAGEITWQVGSLHVYERHFKFVK